LKKKNVAAENCADDQMNGSGCSRNAADRVFTPSPPPIDI
jgi:hypothetical protein